MTTRLLTENVRAVWRPTAPRSPYTYGDFENSHDEKGGGTTEHTHRDSKR